MSPAFQPAFGSNATAFVPGMRELGFEVSRISAMVLDLNPAFVLSNMYLGCFLPLSQFLLNIFLPASNSRY